MAVVIVSFNARDHLLRCTAAVASEDPPEVVIVDNGSSDGSPQLVRSARPQMELLELADNPGYGAAANRGIAACRSPYALLLNADAIPAPGAIAALARYLDQHPRAAVVGPRLENPDGTLQPSCFAFLGSARGLLEKSFLARHPLVWRRLLPHRAHDRERAVPWVMGAALGIRRSAFEQIGGFDPSFFLYAEEVDLCYRLWRAGWEVHFAPVATVAHGGGASTGVQRPTMAIQRVASSRRFYRRHYSPWHAGVLDGMIRAAMLVRWCRDRLRLAATRDGTRRRLLAESLSIWRGALRR